VGIETHKFSTFVLYLIGKKGKPNQVILTMSSIDSFNAWGGASKVAGTFQVPFAIQKLSVFEA